MDKNAVESYRMRRDARLKARGYHADDEEESNGNNNRPSSGGGHGNTRLPFGLCRRMGIEVGSDWTPRDAWDALADKGITPAGEYERLSGRKTAPTIKSFGKTYDNVYAKKGSWFGETRYHLYGESDKESLFGGGTIREKDAEFGDFITKDEMYAYLQEKGVKRFKDPDTGKTVNVEKMELPKTVGKIRYRRYKDVSIGYGDAHRYSIAGRDFAGKRTVLKEFRTEAEARKFAEKMGVKPEDLRETKDFKWYKDKKSA